MAIDQAKVGVVAARLMEELERRGYEEDAEITDVMLIVAVEHSQGSATSIHHHTSGTPVHVALGLLDYVRSGLLGFFKR